MALNHLDLLTEVELETESKLVFSLCETARDMDISESEMEVLDSFIQWASGFRGGNNEEGHDESSEIGAEIV
jgi:hypothetical protein